MRLDDSRNILQHAQTSLWSRYSTRVLTGTVLFSLVRGGCFGRVKDVSSHSRFVELLMCARMIAETSYNMHRHLYDLDTVPAF